MQRHSKYTASPYTARMFCKEVFSSCNSIIELCFVIMVGNFPKEEQKEKKTNGMCLDYYYFNNKLRIEVLRYCI